MDTNQQQIGKHTDITSLDPTYKFSSSFDLVLKIDPV